MYMQACQYFTLLQVSPICGCVGLMDEAVSACTLCMYMYAFNEKIADQRFVHVCLWNVCNCFHVHVDCAAAARHFCFLLQAKAQTKYGTLHFSHFFSESQENIIVDIVSADGILGLDRSG